MIVDVIFVFLDGRIRIYFKKGDELMILFVEGFMKILIVNVGNRVRIGDVFVVVIIRKGEVYYLKFLKMGMVVFIDEIMNRLYFFYYILFEE